MEDKESWLAGVPEGEGHGATRRQLLATAALLRGAIDGIEVPEAAKQRSLQRALAAWDAQTGHRARKADERNRWAQTVGGLLRVVFTLGRHR